MKLKALLVLILPFRSYSWREILWRGSSLERVTQLKTRGSQLWTWRPE